MKLLWIALIINICITVLFFLYKAVLRKDKKKAFLLSIFLLLVPILGAVFLLLSECVYFLLYKGRGKLLSSDELSFSKERTRMIIGNDIEKESDTVPIEEVLRVSNTMSKRQAFLEVLKRPDVEDYMAGIQEAVNQEDTEVVHYAASYITDTIARYKDGERKMRELCAKDDSAEVLLTYLHFSSDMLDKHLFSKPEQVLYINLFESHLEKLYQTYPVNVDGHFISKTVTFLKESKDDTGNIRKWIYRAEHLLEEDVAAAKEVLKFYYEIKDMERFQSCVDRIKKSSLLLDSELVEWVRFFS